MSHSSSPCVTLGLPVYNGENFLRETLDSLLAQTFTDFEIVISDNASTDSTEAICREYQEKDARIRYSRNSENLGAAPNYNRVFDLAKGKYFKWVPHDDTIAPEFLARCVEILEQQTDVVLCYTQVAYTNQSGEPFEDRKDILNLQDSQPQDRFKQYHSLWFQRGFTPGLPVFGLIRTEVLKKTPLIGSYVWSDLSLVGELSLWGEFYEVPEILLFCRCHDQNSRATRQKSGFEAFAAWFNPANKGKIVLPNWTIFLVHLQAIQRVPLTLSQRLVCYTQMLQWLSWKWKSLAKDLVMAVVQVFQMVTKGGQKSSPTLSVNND